MVRKTVLAAALVLTGSVVCTAQNPIDDVLARVEENNLSLGAGERLTQALVLEAKVGNSLPNPSVSYDYAWGKNPESANVWELNVTQEFDFPTAYARRSELARKKRALYGHEYGTLRQEVLLEAKTLCIEIIALRQLQAMLTQRLNNSEKLAAGYAKKLEEGDVDILEKNKIDLELVAARNDWKQNEIDLAAALNRLDNLNGGMPAGFAADYWPQREELLPLDVMTERYQAESPALLAVRAQVDVAQSDLRVSRASSLPGFEVTYRREKGGGSLYDAVAGGVSIPMFGNRNNVKRAKAQVHYADAQYRSSLTDTRTELARLYGQAERLMSSMQQYSALLTPARMLELLNKSLGAGQISVVSYFSELYTVFDVHRQTIELEKDYRTVCAQINVIDL